MEIRALYNYNRMWFVAEDVLTFLGIKDGNSIIDALHEPEDKRWLSLGKAFNGVRRVCLSRSGLNVVLYYAADREHVEKLCDYFNYSFLPELKKTFGDKPSIFIFADKEFSPINSSDDFTPERRYAIPIYSQVNNISACQIQFVKSYVYKGHTIRMVYMADKSWFIAKDIAACVNLKDIFWMCSHASPSNRSKLIYGKHYLIDDEGIMTYPFRDVDGEIKDFALLSADGIRNVLKKSIRPEAKDFGEWFEPNIVTDIKKIKGKKEKEYTPCVGKQRDLPNIQKIVPAENERATINSRNADCGCGEPMASASGSEKSLPILANDNTAEESKQILIQKEQSDNVSKENEQLRPKNAVRENLPPSNEMNILANFREFRLIFRFIAEDEPSFLGYVVTWYIRNILHSSLPNKIILSGGKSANRYYSRDIYEFLNMLKENPQTLSLLTRKAPSADLNPKYKYVSRFVVRILKCVRVTCPYPKLLAFKQDIFNIQAKGTSE